ncbi:MAG: hypothetical protein UU53_C0017G0010, partial [Candidatus Curtissbacteria bacterium GW2011_GWC2_41_21]
GNTNYRQSQSSNYQPPKQLSTNTLKQIKNLESARDISISIIWLFYSVMLLGVGIGAKYKPIRLFALAFLMLTIFKVFVYDSRKPLWFWGQFCWQRLLSTRDIKHKLALFF